MTRGMSMRLAIPLCLALLLLLHCAPVFAQSGLPECLRPQLQDDRGWLVFFDSHSAALTPRARLILNERAEVFLRDHGRIIALNGYTDGAETAPEDAGLGLRRAEAAAALREAGIEPRAIYTKDLGATTPLVPRPPGVVEPQNRRVELIPMLGWNDHALAMQRECKACLRATCFQSLTPDQRTLCERALDEAAPE